MERDAQSPQLAGQRHTSRRLQRPLPRRCSPSSPQSDGPSPPKAAVPTSCLPARLPMLLANRSRAPNLPGSAQAVWNVTTSSSAIRMVGGPPFEIAWACASALRPASDAAHACNASEEGKCISAKRWKGGVPLAALETLVRTAFVAPAAWKIGAAIGMCSAL
jgi:hypothetical protein